jgi:uncharacterized membrane protein YgcG
MSPSRPKCHATSPSRYVSRREPVTTQVSRHEPVTECRAMSPSRHMHSAPDVRAFGPGIESEKVAPRACSLVCAQLAPSIQTYLLSHVARPAEGYNLIILSARALVPSVDVLATPLEDILTPLETIFYSKGPLLAQAYLAANATAASVVNGLIAQTTALRAAAPSSSAGGGLSSSGTGGGGTGGGGGGYAGDAIEECLSGAPFVAFHSAISGLDVSTEAGRRAAFEAATVGDCVLPPRLICSGEVSLARRHDSLGTLLSLKPFLVEWFTHSVVVRPDGTIPYQMARYTVCPVKPGDEKGQPDASLMDAFLRRDYVGANWMGSADKPGLIHYKSMLQHMILPAPHPADHYCVPLRMQELGAFGQAWFSALGFPSAPTAPPPPAVGSAAPPAGYSFLTWCELVATYLVMARSIPLHEARLNWLDEGHEQHVLALGLMGKIVTGELFATAQLRGRTLNAILPYDAEPAKYLRKKMDEFHDAFKLELMQNPFGRGTGRIHVAKDEYELPLRSSRHGRKRPGEPLGKGKMRAGEEDDDEDAPEFVDKPHVPQLRGGKETGPTISHKWLKPNASLLVSGRVWAVDKLAVKYKVKPVNAKCWAFLLSLRQSAARKLAECPTPQHGAHKTATSAAHTLQGFDLQAELEEFSRPATREENLQLHGQQGGGRGHGRGGREGGRGRGRGGAPHFRRPAGA